jgi:NADH-quinone oxidoreductase subunit L
LAFSGVVLAWLCYIKYPHVPVKIKQHFSGIHHALENKYYLDDFNQTVLVKSTLMLAGNLWKYIDQKLIDGILVNGVANLTQKTAKLLRTTHSGYLYHYLLMMILGAIMALVAVMNQI